MTNRRYISASLTPARTSLHGIPKGFQGTRKTLEHIQDLIRQGAKDFFVRQKAIDILLERAVRSKDYWREIKALFEWVQQNVRYTKDPFRVEVLHSARRMLELRAGDCDDMTILLGALLESIGHPVRLVIVGPDPLRPKLFSHIYLEAFHQGSWIALDATMPFPMGWAPRTFVKKIIPLNRRTTDMSGEYGLQGTNTATTPTFDPASLVRAIQGEAVPPRDARVKELYLLLKQRGLWGRNPWLRALLRRIWQRGLAARPRPRITRRLVNLLQRWGINPGISLPAQPGATAVSAAVSRPFAPGALQAGQRLRLVPLRPVVARRVAMRPTAFRPVAARGLVGRPMAFRPALRRAGRLAGG